METIEQLIIDIIKSHQTDWPDATSGDDCYGVTEDQYEALAKDIIKQLNLGLILIK